jgi:hypothetical protein
MIGEPIAMTVGTDVLSLSRVNQDNFSAIYRAESTDGLRRYTFTVKHTLPTSKEPGESHLARLDCHQVDADGATIQHRSVWIVPRTEGSVQQTIPLREMYQGLTDTLELTAKKMLGEILNRES